jgi:hypothetical protein
VIADVLSVAASINHAKAKDIIGAKLRIKRLRWHELYVIKECTHAYHQEKAIGQCI